MKNLFSFYLTKSGGGGAIILSASNVLTAGQQSSWGRKYLD